MPQVRFIHIGNPSPGAKLVAFLILALAIAILIAVGVLAIGLFLFIAPVLLLAAGAYYLYRMFAASPAQTRDARDGIIEGEFRVIDPDAPKITPPQDSPRAS